MGRNKNEKNHLPDKFAYKDDHNDDVFAQNDQDIANKFNKYFVSVGESIIKDLPKSNTNHMEYLKAQTRPSEGFRLRPVNIFQIEAIIRKIQPKFSSGNDEISNFLLKKLCDVISVPLTMLINKSITEGHVAKSLKQSIVVPIFKDGEKQEFGNYRPISLLSCISKILEKVVSSQLVAHLENQDLIYPNQYGFRKKHITTHALLKLLDDVGKNKAKNKTTLSIFCDLRKAFDVVSHDILLQKLNHYGVVGQDLQWFKSYQNGRTQNVKIR